MQPILSRDQMRAFDRNAIEAGVPGLVLMENAGRGAAEHAFALLRELGGARVLVLCGGGNNGGDGYVVARALRTRGVVVELLGATPIERLGGDALVQARAWYAASGETPRGEVTLAELGSALERADLVVDALLGTGANRPVEGKLVDWIGAVVASSRPVLALDVPSGLDADTGRVLGRAVRARVTVTFAHAKRGLYTTAGHAQGGRVVLCDIGVPGTAFPWSGSGAEEPPAAWLLERRDLASTLLARAPTAHKGDSGRVVVVAGGPGKMGAARLSARGALRSGAGLVTIATRDEAASQLEVSAFEEMTARLDAQDPARTLRELPAHTWVVGPGLGLDEAAWRVFEAVLGRSEPVVVDADALHLMALRSVSSLGEGPRVLTPHPGEAARLLGSSVSDVEADRFGAAEALASRFGAVVVLKGSRTIVAAPGEVPRVSVWGSPVLATGGSGDVLSGMLGSLLVHHGLFEGAWLAVGVHALAGEACASGPADPAPFLRDRGVLAREIADAVPDVLASLMSVA